MRFVITNSLIISIFFLRLTNVEIYLEQILPFKLVRMRLQIVIFLSLSGERMR